MLLQEWGGNGTDFKKNTTAQKKTWKKLQSNHGSNWHSGTVGFIMQELKNQNWSEQVVYAT